MESPFKVNCKVKDVGHIQDINLNQAPEFFQKAIAEKISKGEISDLWIQAKNDNGNNTYHAFIEIGNKNITLKYAPEINENKIERDCKEFIL